MKKLIILLLFVSTYASAQISLVAGAGNIYERQGDESKREVQNFWNVGINGQVYTGEGLSHVEINANYRFKNQQGFYFSGGGFLNIFNGNNEKVNVRLLAGALFAYDTYMQESDFIADTRVSVRFDKARLDIGGRVRAMEAFYYSAVPEVYVGFNVAIQGKKKQKRYAVN